MAHKDEVMVALDDLIRATEANLKRNRAILTHAQGIKRQRAKGLTYREIAASEGRPMIVQMISDNFSTLTEAGTRFRKAQAQALHQEGVTMEVIGELFGVSHQRVSVLLSDKRTPAGK